MDQLTESMPRHRRCWRPWLWTVRAIGVGVMLFGILTPIPHRMAWFWAGIVILALSGMMGWR